MLFEIDFNTDIDPDGAGNPKLKELLIQRRKVLESWLKAQSKIVKPDPKKTFRSTFLALHEPFRDSLNATAKRIDEYGKRAPDQQTRPLNIFLNAPPGGGKTTLVRALASIGSQVKEVNLANILAPPDEDLGQLFDLLSQQNQTKRNALPVVFFDEVDSPQFNFYQYMLMPMSDGKYMSHGESKRFGPAIFFFAASDKVTRRQRPDAVFNPYTIWEQEARQDLYEWCRCDDAPKKARDFFSRIDFSIFVPGLYHHLCDCQNDNHACLYSVYWQEEELVHLASQKISQRLGEPKEFKVDRRVLQYIAGAFPSSKRDIDRIIFLSNPASPLEFKWDDLPHDIVINKGEWHRYCSLLPEELVQISI